MSDQPRKTRGREPQGPSPDEGPRGLPRDEQVRALTPDEPTSLGSAHETSQASTVGPELEARSVVWSLERGSKSVGVSLQDLEADDGALPQLRGGEERYQVLKSVGQGGMGRVYLVYDSDLKRRVALKMLRREGATLSRRFVEECQVLAQLEHPNIVPLHDLGVSQASRLYCTMKYVRGHSLKEVLDGLRERRVELERSYSLTRLIQIFLQVTQALGYAHAKGVVHRDIKPANIMLGEHGEVQVLDWGLSKVVSREGDQMELGASLTEDGMVVGTPWYMSPEQAAGQDIDARADVYALGVLLYEMLTLERPFEGSKLEVLTALLRDQPRAPRSRTPDRNIPLELEQICLRALAKQPEQRYASAHEMRQAVQGWLEAEADKHTRRTRAQQWVEQGRERLNQYRAIKAEVGELKQELGRARERFPGWLGVAQKQPLLELEDRVQERQRQMTQAASKTVEVLTTTLGFDPEHREGRELLADLYWERFEEAERRGDDEDQDLFRELLTAYHDGKYTIALRGDGSLRMESDPPGAEVLLHRLEERELRLVPGPASVLGKTPLGPVPLEMGSYLLLLRKPGFRDVRYPVYISRGCSWQGSVRLYTDDEIGDEFVYVPAGPCLQGGPDAGSGHTLEQAQVWLDDFFIARHPVTMQEYLEYLNELAADDLEAARRRGPRTVPDGGCYLLTTPDGRLDLPQVDEHGDRWDPRLPVVGISWHDIEAFCEWRRRREGAALRLPSEQEWEKAARGVDGRAYPWGNRFDPSLCNMRASRRERTAPVPVDEYPHDVSIYDVRGLAGNVRDWTASVVSEGEGELARINQVVRGGGWFNSEMESRCNWRYWYPQAFVFDFFGFRLLKQAPPRS